MKRSETKWIVSALTVLLLLTQGTDAQDKKKPSKGTQAPVVAASYMLGYFPVPPDSATTVDQQLVKDLVSILNSTETPTTFALTVMALEQLGDKAKSTVPSIILNAERLKIFSATNAIALPNTVPSKKQQMATAVAQSIVNLLNGNRTPAVVSSRAQPCVPNYPPPPPTSY